MITERDRARVRKAVELIKDLRYYAETSYDLDNNLVAGIHHIEEWLDGRVWQ